MEDSFNVDAIDLISRGRNRRGRRRDQDRSSSSSHTSFDLGIVSADDIIRESMASSSLLRASMLLDDEGRSSRVSSLSSSSSLMSGMSSYSYSRKSTLLPTEEELPDEVDFEHDHDDDDGQDTSSDDEDIEAVNIKEEKHGTKMQAARQRWAQQVKMKATKFSSRFRPIPAAANKARSTITLPKKSEDEGYNIAGTATWNKWNRWIQDQYQEKKNLSLGRVLEMGMKKDVHHGDSPTEEFDELAEISLEEVISNSRMIRHYAAWLEEKDKSILYFLCSLDEFR